MDYLCAEFGDFIFGRFGFIMRTNAHTDTHRDTHTESHTDADDRYTHATTVCVIINILSVRYFRISDRA